MKRARGVGGLIPPGRRRMTSCHGKRPRHSQNSFIGPKPARSLSFLHTGGLNDRRDPSRAACLVFPDLRMVPIRGFRPGLTKRVRLNESGTKHLLLLLNSRKLIEIVYALRLNSRHATSSVCFVYFILDRLLFCRLYEF